MFLRIAIFFLWSLQAQAFTYSPKELPIAYTLERMVVLLDEQGNEAAVRVGDQGRTPFAMMLGVTSLNGQLDFKFCTGTHLKGSYVVTAAHCVPTAADATFWVFFYTKEGKRQLFPIREFYFKGKGSDDIAMAKLPEEAVAMWDETNFRYNTFDKPADGHDVPITMWSYTPLPHFTDFQTKFQGRSGMVFRPNRCSASRLAPRVTQRDRRTKKVTAKIALQHDLKGKDHLFIDRCQYAIVPGNSGSLITHEKNFDYKLGVLDLTFGDHAAVWKQLTELGYTNDPTKELIYYSVDGKPEPFTYELGLFSLGAGTLFETIERRSPAALPRP